MRTRLARALADGQVLTFPSETSYALGGNALSSRLVETIYALKGRERAKPLLLLVSAEGERNGWDGLVGAISPGARALMECLWPGALTLVLPGGPALPAHLADGHRTAALRCSPHPLVRELLQLGGVPLIGTSANLSGQPALHSAEEVLRAFPGTPILAVDGGRTSGGPPSTVLDTTVQPFRILRAGAVSAQAIRDALLPAHPRDAPARAAEEPAWS